MGGVGEINSNGAQPVLKTLSFPLRPEIPSPPAKPVTCKPPHRATQSPTPLKELPTNETGHLAAQVAREGKGHLRIRTTYRCPFVVAPCTLQIQCAD